MSLFADLLKQFELGKVDYVIVGGFAVVLHGHLRFTGDIDLVVRLDESNILRTVEILKAASFSPRLPVDPEELAQEETRKRWIAEKGMTFFSFVQQSNALVGVDIFVEYTANVLNFGFNILPEPS